MSDEALTLIIVGVIALAIIGFLLYLAAGLILAFTAFVIKLPLILSILMFVLFPPSFIVFLIGLALIYFGFVERLAGEPSERELAKQKARLKELGYDD